MQSIAVEWKIGGSKGNVDVSHGEFESLKIIHGDGNVDRRSFAFESTGRSRLAICVTGENTSWGPYPTIVTVRADSGSFTVLLRDVSSRHPILIPEYGVVVTEAQDKRSFAEIESAIMGNASQRSLAVIEAEPEESYDIAASATRSLHCPIWLGLGRDMRLFEADYGYESHAFFIQPRFHGAALRIPEIENLDLKYSFAFGRGVGCVQNITRRLEEGALPIINGRMADDGVVYDFTAFASLEKTPLTTKTVRGTHYLVADEQGLGHMLTPEQQAECDARRDEEMNRDEEIVLFHRILATNTSPAPRYAYFKMPIPDGPFREMPSYTFMPEKGLGLIAENRVYVAAKLNEIMVSKEEIAVLLDEGQTATFDFFITHRPISESRAEALSRQSFEQRLDECREYWSERLAVAAKVDLPEKRVEEMLRAGLLHLDLVLYGLEPNGTVVPCTGIYNGIGSESSPIIQAMDSMGWHELAERSIQYFIDKQREDGFIQNFADYMLETGPVLWTIGEHYRYTHDDEWLVRIMPAILKSCEYIIEWRNRNKRDELVGMGYGMLDGKVADPDDFFHSFMLNSYAYLGLSRVAEILVRLNPSEAARLGGEAEAFKADIRTAVFECLAKSPAVPLNDGTWCPSLPPWPEARGPVSLLIDEKKWWTHGAFVARDSMIGPIYLVFGEVFEADELVADWLINYHADLFNMRNVALSQPYYSTHQLAHLQRREVKAFLKSYYNTFAGLADRETYTFSEHFWRLSHHKTHEEAWFLMQTRWMLYLEEGDTLRLLPGIPRDWMEDGRTIVLENVASYFGPVSLHVESRVGSNSITARVACTGERQPDRVLVRLPHPLHKTPSKVIGGEYISAEEAVMIESFRDEAVVSVEY